MFKGVGKEEGRRGRGMLFVCVCEMRWGYGVCEVCMGVCDVCMRCMYEVCDACMRYAMYMYEVYI